MLLAVILALSSSCLHEPMAPPVPNCDMGPFIIVWETLEEHYPLFQRKDLNWVEMAEIYYSQAAQCTTEDELYQVIFNMMAEIEDPALALVPAEGDILFPYTRDYESNVDMDVLVNNYLQPRGYEGVVKGFGRCDPEVFPYAYFESFPDAWTDTMGMHALDSFIVECVELDVPAIILDIRMNPQYSNSGGYMGYSHLVMSRFVSKAKVSAVYRFRCGPRYDMLTDFHPWIQPGGSHQYDGTVYLLTGGACTHGAEDMAVNLGYFDNFVLIGDTTAGDITFTGSRVLDEDNNWFVRWGKATVLTHDFEWVQEEGIPPDVYVEATPGDFAAGVDPVMEYAIQLLDN